VLESVRGGSPKAAVLVWLSVQTALHSLLLRYSRARPNAMYYSSVAVFLTEVLKAIVCLAMMVVEAGGPFEAFMVLVEQVFTQPWDNLRVCIPAILYTVLNNLMYVAASHLDAATFMVTNQMKIFSTALFSVLLLGTRLTALQWLSLVVLFAGICLVQVHPKEAIAKKLIGAQEMKEDEQDPVVGFTAVCIASVLSGFAGVYFERILKESSPVSIWTRNVQMSIFAIPSSLAAVLIADGSSVMKNGMLYGFDYVVWTVVVFYCVGGLSVAVTIKYADNISKNFATSFAILLSMIGSVWMFNFVPNWFFMAGALLVVCSIFMYSSAGAKQKKRTEEEDAEV